MDVLRGGSALVVAVVHAFQVFILPYCGLGTAPHLYTSFLATHAVTIFFVVSGFMICLSVFRHQKAGEFDDIGFAKARVFRIYPPLIAALLITILVYLTISGLALHGSESYRLGGELAVSRENVKLEWSSLPSTFFLLYGAVPHVPPPINMDGPLWTLGYEWWFYILVFLTVRLSNGMSFRTIAPLLIVAVMLIVGRNGLFFRFLVVWLSGYALGYAYMTGRLFLPNASVVLLLIIAALVAATLAIGDTANLLLHPFDTSPGQNLMVIIGTSIAVCVAFALRFRDHLQFPQWLCGTAAFSYTLYVIHFPLLLLAYSLLHPVVHGHNWAVAAFFALLAGLPIIYISAMLAHFVEDRRSILGWRKLKREQH